jgi:phospholipid-binding lipoprotein MlaA
MRNPMMTLCPLRLALSRLSMIGLLLLAGCAAAGHPRTAGGEDFNDPFENTNRAIFRFNQKVDANVLVPVAKGYRAVVPPPARDALRDFFDNLRGPIILANDVLQGNVRLAGDTLGRFLLNSTLGMAGFVDIAGRWGIPYHDQDFGLTFATWGVPEGPYLVVPVLGPSNPRDLSGTIAESFADPWDILAGDAHYLWAPLTRHIVNGVDERSRYIETLADLQRTSLDYYAAIRSLYRQRRAALLHHEQKNLPANPSLGQGGGPVPIADK